MELIDVTPIGTRRSPAFVTRVSGCSYEELELPEYPDSPPGRAMRSARVAAGITMGGLGRALRIRTSQVSGLEHGSLTTDDDGWREVMDEIERWHQ